MGFSWLLFGSVLKADQIFRFGEKKRRLSKRSRTRLLTLHVQELEERVAMAVNVGNAKPYWGNGHYYAYTKEDNDWTDARDRSLAATLDQLGTKGYLASITSSGENDFIVKYSYKGQAIPKKGFLGGSDSTDRGTSEGIWMWKGGGPDQNNKFREGGKNLTYTNWDRGQPDNDNNQDYLVLRPDGKWDDDDADNSDDGYITEWGRDGVEFNAEFADLGSSGTVNGQENGQTAKMTINFDRFVPNDYVDIRDNTPLIDIPITFTGTAKSDIDYKMTVSGGNSYFSDGRLYVRKTQSVTLTFTPINNNTWQSPRTIKATLGSDGSENIYGISGNASSQVWVFDDEPLLSLGQGAYQFIRAPYTAGSSQTLPTNNTDFNTSADTLIFDTDGIDQSESKFNEQGFYDTFAMRWETYVSIPETGNYTFRALSNDGHKLTLRRNNSNGLSLASLSNWSDGSKTAATSAISLSKGDVVWLQFDYYEKSGTASAQLLWDRPNGSGGVISNQVIPGSAMFLSESLARGVNHTESATEDTRALGFQIFSNKEASSLLNVKLASTSDTSNSTVDNTIAQRRTDNTKVGDDYAIYEDSTGGSQITAAVIGLNDSYGTLQWQPNKTSGSLENVKSFYVQVLSDSYAEANESVTLKLGGDTGYGVSNNNQTLSIGDSAIVLSVKAGQNPQEGGSNEADLGWFTVSTNNRPAPNGGIRVRYAIKGGTATRNADYTAPQSTLSTTSYKAEDLIVIPAGAMESRIYIAALADAIREGDETVILELQTNIETDDKNFKFQRYIVDSSASQATLTITDSTSYSAALVTTPADRTGLSTVRAQLSNGNQVASFDVHISSQPRADVTLTLATTSGTLSKQELTFTASNWTQPQRVTLTGQRIDQATTVSLKSASSDQQYSNLSTQQRIVPSSWSSELELSLWEGGVQLLAQPAASVLPVDGTEGPASHFGFDLSLGAPAQGSPVELLYTLNAGAGFVHDGGSADVTHKPDAIYRPLVLTNTASSGGRAYANLGNLTTVSDRGEFSAQAWVRRDASDGGDTVLDFSNANGQNEIWLGFADSSNKPRLVIRSSSGAVLAQLTAESPVALSEWNHLALSIDSTNIASLYVNGELTQRQKLSSGLSRLARASNFLGRSVNGEYLDGAIRGVAIWNVARGQEEIQASMLSETQDGSGLISCLPLNNSLANQVGSAPPAELVNGSTNKASFAADPIFGLQVPVGESRVSLNVMVIDDLVAEGEESLTLSLVDSGRYSIGGSSATGTAELSDNDSAGFDFLAAWSNLENTSTGWTSTSQFTVSETDQAQKTQTRMGVRLTSRPTADVRLTLKSNSGVSSDILVNLASDTTTTNVELLFTPDNWDTVQELWLQGIDDKTFDGDLTRQLDFKVASTDKIYADLSPGVSVLVLDDETYTANTDLAASQNGQAPMVRISAPSQSTIKESGTDSAQFTITLTEPATQDTLVFFNLEQSNRQLYARDFVVTASQNAQSFTGLARFDTSNTSSTEITSIDSDGINETTATFAANGQSGNFTSTWSGYIAIPETGSYYFSTMVQGGVRLRLDGKMVIDQMIDTKATWSTETLQLTRGDFVAVSLDYNSFNTTSPALSLSWQRPQENAAESVKELVPAEALSRVDGIHLLIAKGSSSATVTVAGVDDSIDENDEALDVRLLSARGVELVVSGQSTATDGNTLLDFTLGTTDREAVTLVAGTVLSLGKNLDSTGSKSSKLAQFTISETATLHRDRSARIRGTLVWVDEATNTSYSGLVVNLVTSTDNDLYQVPDRSVTLSLTAPLVADSISGQDSYLASIKLEQTNLGSFTIPAGTKLVYRTTSSNDTATLVLVNSLTLQSGQSLSSVAVRAESVSSGLDLTTSASPLVGLKSMYEIANSAVVTILDDDTAGLQFYTDKDGSQAVSSAHVVMVEQGNSLTRYVRLASQPNDSVTVYFETSDTSEVRLQIPATNPEPPSARIAMTFTPENWKTPKAFSIVPIDDRLVDGDQNVNIYSRTTSSDSFYSILSAGSLAFVVQDNDKAGLNVELQQSIISKAGNGFINLSLGAQPTDDVVVSLNPEDQQFTINDRSVGRSETLVFTPDNWSTLQTVSLYAVDDNAVEDITTSNLSFSTTSSDTRFHSLTVEPVKIVITDNDLPTATLEMIKDGTEDGRPGRFRIRLSAAAPGSAGSKGLVVNYQVSAVELDSDLPYGSDIGGRLTKIAQYPTSVNGSVRIAPGQSTSDLLVVPIDDFLADRASKAITVKLTSGDEYTISSDSSGNSATVRIINNDVAGLLVMTSGERILTKESGGNATFQLALLSEPIGDVTVTVQEKVANGARRQLGTATASYTFTTTFTRSNWFTPQQISVQAYDDKIIEDGTDNYLNTGIHGSELYFTFASSDANYNSASHSGESSYFTNYVQKVDVLDYELSDKTASSLQSSLTFLQEGVDSLSLPIVGSLGGKTGQGLRKFILNLSNSIRQVGTPTPKKLGKLISREIASALGVSEDKITVTLQMNDLTGSNAAVVVGFQFADKYDVLSVPLAADFGLPGLGFKTKGSFDASFSYDAALEIVFPRSGDIYLNTAADKTYIQANFNAGLSDNFSLTGGLGFMQLVAVNQPSVNDNVKLGDNPAKTELDVSFQLTLADDAGSDSKLTFTELTSNALDLEKVFQYSLTGVAAMSLGVTTSVNGSAAIPSFKFDLSSIFPLFDYSNQEEADEEANATTFYFDNIRLDLGSYISDMLNPIVGGLDDILKPLYPLVDALYSDTKIFDKLGLGSVFDTNKDGKTSTIDMANWFAGFYAKIDSNRGKQLKNSVDETIKFLDMLKGVMDLVRDLKKLSDEDGFYVDFGSYELEAWKAADKDADPANEKVDEEAKTLETDTKDQADKGGKDKNGENNSSFKKIMDQLDELGFTIPLIEEPANAIKLLFGQDVSLFEWRMPVMGMSSEIDKTFPIYGGIEGVIEGGYEVKAHLGFGFDTYGLSQWRKDNFASGDAWKVFNGFYVADLDSKGKDIAEFTMDASMGAGLGYSARVVRADITGGLEAAASFDLLDEGEIAGTSDGKIRGQEITDRISNPLNLFEITGELVAYVKSRVQIGIDMGFYSIWDTVWERRLAEIPIFKFGIGGRYGSGTVSNGHLAGTTVFFDANFNGRIDALEPVTVSDADGQYSLEVDLRRFDTNHNGSIDNDEGRLMIFGGTDTSMDMPLKLPFLAPLGTMVTPLTTLYSLAIGAGVPQDEADAFIRKAFDLGDFDYLHKDPLSVLKDATNLADPTTWDALSAYMAHVKLHFAADLVTGALEQLLPNDAPNDLAGKLDLLNGFSKALREKPTSMTMEEGLGKAITEAWKKSHPDNTMEVANLTAKAGELAAAAGREVVSRLDALRDEAIRNGASPASLLAQINALKKEVFSLYRNNLEGISQGLYRITSPDELLQTVAARLKAVHGNFLNKPPSSVGFINTVTSLVENPTPTARMKVADILVNDDEFGINSLVLTGNDAALFEIDGKGIYLKAGLTLDYESKASYLVTVEAIDTAAPALKPVSADFRIAIVNVKEAPTIILPQAGFIVQSNRRSPLLFNASPLGTTDTLANKRVSVLLAVSQGRIGAISGSGVTSKRTPGAVVLSGTLANLNRFFTRPGGSIFYRSTSKETGSVWLTFKVIERTRGGLSRRSASSNIVITQPII